MSGKTAKKARLRARVERGGGAEHLEPPVYLSRCSRLRSTPRRKRSVVAQGRVDLGYTPRDRSVSELLFWTLWNRENYGRVTVAQGVAQRDGGAALRRLGAHTSLG